MIKYQDIITLSDNNKYIVASIINHNNKDYVYLVDINDNKSLLFAEIEEDGNLSIIDQNNESELLNELIPLFYNSSKKDIEI